LRSDAITGANVSGNNDNNSDHLPKGSIPQSTKFQPNNLPIKRGYWCEYCSVGFNKRKSYLEHVAGKRHKAVVAEGDLAWEDYLARGTDSVFWDTSVTQMDVAKAWSLDVFAEGLRARGRSSKKKVVGRNRMVGTLSPPSLQHHTGNNANGGGGNQIDPTLRLGDLAPSKCGALFRYLHTTTSGIQCLPDVVEALPPVYVRIKELLESIEVYHQFRELIRQRGSRRGQSRRLSRVYDIGCGHGLVGMLIAASCPHIEVVSIDIVPRESFVAQKEAFRVSGRPLTNLKFEAGDLSMLSKRLKVEEEDGTNEHALVLCVHGCKELTHESIELAREHEFAWLALPCCLQEKDHLSKGSLKIKSDATRYAMLCGVLAANHDPEVVTTIDSRITGRNIVLASAGGKG
jgi:SAM-dependent methyltransferase